MAQKTWIENINEALDGGSATTTNDGEGFSPEAMEKIESLSPKVDPKVVKMVRYHTNKHNVRRVVIILSYECWYCIS